MYLIRDLMYCKPGKVRPMIEKFRAISRISEAAGQGKMRVYTDMAGEQFWTIIAEFEVESLDKIMSMEGMSPEALKEMETIMKDYHDLVDRGRREIYKVEV